MQKARCANADKRFRLLAGQCLAESKDYEQVPREKDHSNHTSRSQEREPNTIINTSRSRETENDRFARTLSRCVAVC